MIESLEEAETERTEKQMEKREKYSQEAIIAVEDKIAKIAEPLTDLERATLYTLLYSQGMDLQRAHEIRVKSGAIN